MTLTINLATRARPAMCIETLEKTLPNIVLPSTKLMVSIDHDDAQTIAALTKFAKSHPKIILSVKQREDSLGEKYNRALADHPADVYLPMVDYAPHVTPGFDQMIVDAAGIFPDNIGVVYNELANASFPGINGITHGLAAKMGFLYPPWFPYWFVDHWLDDIARMINRIAYVEVKLDRLKRPGTQDCRDLKFWTILFDMLYLRRRECAHSIILSRDFMEPHWRKRLSLAHHPLIEFRSRWVNDGMRQDPAGIEVHGSKGIPDEERYVRIKQRAQQLMGELLPEFLAEEARKAA